MLSSQVLPKKVEHACSHCIVQQFQHILNSKMIPPYTQKSSAARDYTLTQCWSARFSGRTTHQSIIFELALSAIYQLIKLEIDHCRLQIKKKHFTVTCV